VIAMSEHRVTPREADEAVTIDLCDRCHGVWLDENELAGLCPSVSDLPSRRGEIELLAAARPPRPDQPPRAPAVCPRCEASLVVFAVVDVEIDFCVRCGGVWLDGHEVAELMLPPVDEGAGRPKGQKGAYRANALRAVRRGVIDCKSCGTTTPIDRAFVRPDGLVCTICHVGAVQSDVLEKGSARLPILAALLRIIDALVDRGFLPASLRTHPSRR
jgi:Zn-finger nucleic acid-binding protein